MSTTSRNDPCPCGSGRKYKRCCLAGDLQRARHQAIVPGHIDSIDRLRPALTLEPDDPGEAEAVAIEPGATWMVDIVPLPMAISHDSSARSAMGLVVDSSGMVLLIKPIEAAPSELESITEEMEALVEEAAASVGVWPATVRVRYPQIRALLAPGLSRRRISVRSARRLAALDRARRDFAQKALGLGELADISAFIGRWSQFGAPRTLIAEVFDAAGEFYRSRPWSMLTADDAFDVVLPGEAQWTALVLGSAGATFGLVLLEQRSDVRRVLQPTDGTKAPAVQGSALYCTFDDNKDVPREFREEVKRNRWTLPAADIYPVLVAINTPAGGVTRRQLHGLAKILRATAAFSVSLPELVRGEGTAGFWSHSATGVNFLFDRRKLAFAVMSQVTLPLAIAGPEGAAAEPLARLDPDSIDEQAERERGVLPEFGAWMHDRGKRTDPSRQVSDVRLFVDFLTLYQGIRLNAVNEYDLRVFLHDWMHRKVMMSDEDAATIPESLTLFFEFLAESKGLVCPWAQAVIGDRATIRHRRQTFPGGFFWDPGVDEWRGALGPSLAARALIPQPADSESVGGQGTMGSVEAMLESELERLWLVWRDELVRDGMTSQPDVVAALVERVAKWERAPHRSLGGATPRKAIAKERRQFLDPRAELR